ncbi:hypothetical protein C8R45DRAFT_104753 [Mycena sanguinolenta]|nr:hypothetical protein C8R45DRAFT_104753 [Mycena sanguinolenta]
MSLDLQTIERLTNDAKTIEETKKLLQRARANTGVGSGFDLGEDRTGLVAVCTYLASEKLNNTNVTFTAAQVASCQTKLKFKKLHGLVVKALEPAQRKPLNYGGLLTENCSQIVQTAAVRWMDEVEVRVWEKLKEDEDEELTEDEVTCAVFISVCNAIEKRLFHPNSFEDKYETNPGHMRKLIKLITTVCGPDAEKFRAAYDKAAESRKSASVSPRKSPTKPALRTLPSRDSPQKRKVTFPDPEEDADVPESPTKKQKVAPTLVTLESIRAMAPSTPSTPRKSTRLSASPSKSPTKHLSTRTPVRAGDPDSDAAMSSSEEEDYEPPSRRRFRPVFLDQKQWAMCEPRLAKLAVVSVKSVPKRKRRDSDALMDVD